jgi:hypothetical protein
MAEPWRPAPEEFRRHLLREARRGNPLATAYLLRVERAPDRAAETVAVMAELQAAIGRFLRIAAHARRSGLLD